MHAPKYVNKRARTHSFMSRNSVFSCIGSGLYFDLKHAVTVYYRPTA